MKNELSLVAQNDSVIISLQRASMALAEAKTIQHTKKIIDVSAAAEIYAKRQHLGEAAVAMATSIKVEALRKLGEMLKATPKAKGGQPFQKSTGSTLVPVENQAETLAELGIDKRTSSVAQALANLSDEAFEEVREGNETVSKAIAKVKEHKEKAVPAKPAKPAAQTPEPASDSQELKEAAHTINQLAVENEQLRDRLAVEQMDVSEEGKGEAAQIIEELRKQVKNLEAELDATKSSRDGYQRNNSELMKQVRMLTNQLKKQEA